MLIVIGGHTPKGTPFVIGSHHLTREFRALGHDVAHISFPLTPGDVKVADHLNHKRVRARLWRRARSPAAIRAEAEIVPVSPFPWGVVRRLGIGRARRIGYPRLMLPGARRAVDALDRAPVDLLIVDHPRQFWLVDALAPRRLIYRPTDIYSAPGDRDDAIYREIETWLMARAVGVVMTSHALLPRMRALSPRDDLPMAVIENGVDLAAFAGDAAPEPRALAGLPAPRLIYVGAFDDRFDLALLIAAAHASPAFSFVLGGPMPDDKRAALAGLPNVTCLGPLAYADVPAHLRHADVGLLPFSAHAFNAARSPMKLFEYAASGLPVVANRSPELESRALPFCFFFDGAADFPAAVDRALAYRANGMAEAAAIARERSWAGIAARVLTLADEWSGGRAAAS